MSEHLPYVPRNQGLAGKGAPAPRARAPLPGAGVQKKCHPLPPGKKGVLRIRGGDVDSWAAKGVSSRI